VVLDVNDLERASAFWSAALGFPFSGRSPSSWCCAPMTPKTIGLT
jgi:hypothetical protein